MGTPMEAGILEPELRTRPGERTVPGLAADESGPAIPRDLADALHKIDRAEATALENDLPIPSTRMLEDTRVLLRRLYEAYPRRYMVYPSISGDMVIYACPEYGRSIMIVRRADGRARCSVRVPEKPKPVDCRGEGTIPGDALRKVVAVLNGQEGL